MWIGLKDERKYVPLSSLVVGSLFIEPGEFDDQVFLIISDTIECKIKFNNEEDTIAAVNLCTGAIWAFNKDILVVEVIENDFISVKYC